MILQKISEFWDYYKTSDIEIYNEFSFQHELGIFLRDNLSGYKVQFERNVRYFINDESIKTRKKEIDIVVYNEKEKFAIELKYPRHGQYPVRMFKFIEDIQFMEELKQNGFDRTFVVAIVDEKEGKGFFGGQLGRSESIYHYFRSQGQECIHGDILYPCAGKQIAPLKIEGKYKVDWKVLPRDLRGYIIEIEF